MTYFLKIPFSKTMKFEKVLQYKKHIIATTLAIGLGALSISLWPSCSRHIPKQTAPSPVEEILSLKTEVSNLSSSVDTLTELNSKLMEENRVLKSMLVECMKRHMEEDEE